MNNILAKKLSTDDVVVFHKTTGELYLVQPGKKDIMAAGIDTLKVAQELTLKGHGVRLDSTQLKTLDKVTSRIEFLA